MLNGALPSFGVTPTVCCVEQLAAAHEDRDLVLLVEEVEQALVLAVDDLQRTLERGVVVERDVAGDFDAELGRAFDLIEHIGRLEKRLGGDAAAVEAGAAEHEFFDNGDIRPSCLARMAAT